MLYHTSAVPDGRDEEQIKRHLVHCLEMPDGERSAVGHLARCAPRNAAAGPAPGHRGVHGPLPTQIRYVRLRADSR